MSYLVVRRNLWVTILAHGYADTILLAQVYFGASFQHTVTSRRFTFPFRSKMFRLCSASSVSPLFLIVSPVGRPTHAVVVQRFFTTLLGGGVGD
jgi:hypothetical protein